AVVSPATVVVVVIVVILIVVIVIEIVVIGVVVIVLRTRGSAVEHQAGQDQPEPAGHREHQERRGREGRQRDPDVPESAQFAARQQRRACQDQRGGARADQDRPRPGISSSPVRARSRPVTTPTAAGSSISSGHQATAGPIGSAASTGTTGTGPPDTSNRLTE